MSKWKKIGQKKKRKKSQRNIRKKTKVERERETPDASMKTKESVRKSPVAPSSIQGRLVMLSASMDHAIKRNNVTADTHPDFASNGKRKDPATDKRIVGSDIRKARKEEILTDPTIRTLLRLSS